MDIHVEVAGRVVRVSSPDKVLFPDRGWTKRDIVEHYVRCAAGAVRGTWHRPTSLKRWPGGVTADFFFTKRAPGTMSHAHPVQFPSARPGNMPYVEDAADLIEQVQLGVLDLNPWNARIDDLDHPDELRIDLDPTEGFTFEHCREIAGAVRSLLTDKGLVGWPKTSGSRGIHVYVRIAPRWDYFEVRRAGLALARELERRTDLATTSWWKEERTGVFIDYNQNARDRTIASAYSVRARPDATVSAPVAWDELPDVETEDFTMATMPGRFAALGDVQAGIGAAVCDLRVLLEWVERDAGEGLGEAPYPPNFPKMPGEPKRVQPSRARRGER